MILMSCANGNFDIVREIGRQGVNLNYSNVDGRTPLLAAASSGNVELVRFLLESGNDPNARDLNGWTPLAEAMFSNVKGCLAVAQELIHAGARVNLTNGRPPLALAVRLGKQDLVKLLIDSGADTNATDPLTGRSVLLSFEQNAKATGEFISNYVRSPSTNK
jgi:ankyrin repeat protein